MMVFAGSELRCEKYDGGAPDCEDPLEKLKRDDSGGACKRDELFRFLRRIEAKV